MQLQHQSLAALPLMALPLMALPLMARPLMAVLLMATLPFMTGCTLFDGPDSSDPSSRFSANLPHQSAHDVSLASHETDATNQGDVLLDEGLDIEDFYPSNVGQTVRNMTGRGPDHELARKLFDEGDQLYQQAVAEHLRDAHADTTGRFGEASAKFSEAAKRWPDSALEEDAIFLAAESQFFANKYVLSNELFESLLKKYPNTRHLDIVGARRFLIAEYWLQLDKADPQSFWEFNFTDDQKPWSDSYGHAVRIFDRMRLDDPTGKLADDATIAAANACFAEKDYVKADQYYSDLRKTFPSSEHQFMAHFLGLKAKLASYKGAEYAGTSLEEAEKLIKQIRRQFPREAREHENEIDRAHREVRYKMAEREWNMAQFYDRRREFGAARFYYERLLSDFSDTPFARDSETRVEVVASEPAVPPQKFDWLVRLFPDPDREPLIATSPGTTSPDGTVVR